MSVPDREQARRQMTARALDNDTICAEHRALWALAQQLPEGRIRASMESRLLTAYIMAKKMDAKLREYHAAAQAARRGA